MKSPESKAVNAICTLYGFPVGKIRNGGWVAYFGQGPEYCVHITEPFPGKWVARRPRALEHIGIGADPIEAMMMAKKHIDAYRAEIQERVCRKLSSPEVQSALAKRA